MKVETVASKTREEQWNEVLKYEAVCGEIEPVFPGTAFRLEDIWEPPVRKRLARLKGFLMATDVRSEPSRPHADLLRAA